MKINIGITGLIPFPENLISLLDQLYSHKSFSTINKIFIITWNTRISKSLKPKFANMPKIEFILIDSNFIDISPFSSFRRQRRLFRHLTKLQTKNEICFKTRSDLSIDWNFIFKVLNMESIKNGQKIWVPNFCPEYPCLLADHSIIARNDLLSNLYKRNSLPFVFKSGNGMRCHINTWASFIENEFVKLISFSNLYKQEQARTLKNLLVHLDIGPPNEKTVILRNIYTKLRKNEDFLFLQKKYLDYINNRFFIGDFIDMKSVPVYLIRQGQNFHSSLAVYSKGNGNWVWENMNKFESPFSIDYPLSTKNKIAKEEKFDDFSQDGVLIYLNSLIFNMYKYLRIYLKLITKFIFVEKLKLFEKRMAFERN